MVVSGYMRFSECAGQPDGGMLLPQDIALKAKVDQSGTGHRQSKSAPAGLDKEPSGTHSQGDKQRWLPEQNRKAAQKGDSSPALGWTYRQNFHKNSSTALPYTKAVEHLSVYCFNTLTALAPPSNCNSRK